MRGSHLTLSPRCTTHHGTPDIYATCTISAGVSVEGVAETLQQGYLGRRCDCLTGNHKLEIASSQAPYNSLNHQLLVLLNSMCWFPNEMVRFRTPTGTVGGTEEWYNLQNCNLYVHINQLVRNALVALCSLPPPPPFTNPTTSNTILEPA